MAHHTQQTIEAIRRYTLSHRLMIDLMDAHEETRVAHERVGDLVVDAEARAAQEEADAVRLLREHGGAVVMDGVKVTIGSRDGGAILRMEPMGDFGVLKVHHNQQKGSVA